MYSSVIFLFAFFHLSILWSCIVGPTTNDLSQAPVSQPRISVAGLHSASPWLCWSRNPFNELAGSQAHTISAVAEDSCTATSTSSSDGNALTSWERRLCTAFLARYAQYLQSEVGFRPVIIGSTGGLQMAKTTTDTVGTSQTFRRNANNPNCSYGLFHRAIHLTGVHIMEASDVWHLITHFSF